MAPTRPDPGRTYDTGFQPFVKKLRAACVVLAALAGWITAGVPLGQAQADELPAPFPIWPGGVGPGSEGVSIQESVVERSADPTLHDRYTLGITRPHLVVYRPSHPNGTALLVMPGGGYRWVVVDKEGDEIGRRLSAAGVTVFVLTYRLPGEGHAQAADVPLQDAQRALRLIRARAAEWGLDPHRIGAMGLSAGGHVAASLGTRYDAPVYAPVDTADQQSARPDFLALIYPVASMDPAIAHKGSRNQLLGATPTPAQDAAYSTERSVTSQTPPTFLLHADDDPSVPVENSLRFYAALHAAKVPAELHIFRQGGHGFGLRGARGLPVAAWPDLYIAWVRGLGMMP
ncbi:alpha/beta hydrolase [Nitrospirillum pindoramense]|uniref:Acetyl esterase/lipase n=1 Tax=Nitrospirillum amazonense TaxID=28077 RepID=A0A560HFJ9_9PROT|nr:alpha/beta hydrolase [Nitrospirillum amazonense]TWB44399.1 acetyl esterase/lipase [Nitrospirillum amazonense]